MGRRDDALRRVKGKLTGSSDMRIELRGRIASALRMKDALVTSREEATKDGALIPLFGPRGYCDADRRRRAAHRGHATGARAGPEPCENEIEALDRLAHHAGLAIANARLHAHMSEMAITDPLTGLANHGEMQSRLAFESGRLARYATLRAAGHHLSVILLDIDHFKKFNDRFGHQAGDAVLKGVSAALKGATRSFDIAARYGGEEFAVILPETTEEAAREVADASAGPSRCTRSRRRGPSGSRDGQCGSRNCTGERFNAGGADQASRRGALPLEGRRQEPRDARPGYRAARCARANDGSYATPAGTRRSPRSRRIAARSRAVVPPQTPNSSRLIAHSRHFSRTGQDEQRVLAFMMAAPDSA